MIKSMTGFGKATGSYNDRQLTVELKSVNSKSLDLSMRMPMRFREKEQELKADISKLLERGKIEVYIHYENGESVKTVSINKDTLKSYYDELKAIDNELNLNTTDFLPVLLRMPDVVTSESQEDLDEDEWKTLLSIYTKAVEAFNNFRIQEGKNLETDLLLRIDNIEKHLQAIEKAEPRRIEAVKERMKKGLASAGVEVDKNRFEQELIYYIEKLDITEEKVRLRSHCEYFINTLKEDVSNGRKLGFIGQEIGREINTIGSKANDADIQKNVVQMKDELEKVKEQVLNVL